MVKNACEGTPTKVRGFNTILTPDHTLSGENISPWFPPKKGGPKHARMTPILGELPPHPCGAQCCPTNPCCLTPPLRRLFPFLPLLVSPKRREAPENSQKERGSIPTTKKLGKTFPPENPPFRPNFLEASFPERNEELMTKTPSRISDPKGKGEIRNFSKTRPCVPTNPQPIQ